VDQERPNFFSNPWLARRTRRAMERGAKAAVAELRATGVTRSISFLGFHCDPVVWLVTATDDAKDAVCRDGIPRPLVIEHLLKAGVRADLAAAAGVTVESQETVDRDWDGNWHFAMR
jgi:hypothetical protein